MNQDHTLDLRPDEWVEVRSEAEILATLDSDGTLEGLPFMPEMLAHCGRRYQVFKRADRTCDPVSAEASGLFRQMLRTVHLSMLRCDGLAHGGCQAACLMYWKEAWLKRSPVEQASNAPAVNGAANGSAHKTLNGAAADTLNGSAVAQRDRAWLEPTVYHLESTPADVRYRCQATEVNKASCPLPWWGPKQYVRDVRDNGVPVWEVVRSIAILIISRISKVLTGHQYPNISGKLKKTPVEKLGIVAGDWVIVRNREEIQATLDEKGRNRGLAFESEMLPYCGKRYRVQRQVERLIEEPTGRMKELSGVALVLEGVICASRYRRACPRANQLYWREIWLRRATDEEIQQGAEGGAAADLQTTSA